MADSTIQQKLSAEVLGTFVLVFFGCGSVVYASTAGATFTVTTVGLTFGLAVLVMAYAFGRVSGAHFNPAVSVGAAISGRMAWRQVVLYVVAQLVGAIIGGLALYVLMQGSLGVVRNAGKADALTLFTLTAGDLIAELSFIDATPHYASLVAQGPVRVFGLERERLESLLDSHPQVVYRVMRAIVRATHQIQRRLSMQSVELTNYISKQHGKY